MEKETKVPSSIRLTLAAKERFNSMIESYKNEAVAKSDQQEDALMRILDVAEAESVKGLHPELEGQLTAIEGTITSLIKQINGIVAGQDQAILDAKKERDDAIIVKDKALESVSKKEAELREKNNQLMADILKARSDRAEVVQKLDDAREFVSSRAENIQQLKKEIERLQKERDDFELKLDQVEKQNEELQNKIRHMEHEKMTAELEKEKAIIEKERELRDAYEQKLRDADKENAKLQVKIEQLEA